LTLVRLTPDGTLDASLGSNGVQQVFVPGVSDYGYDILTDAAGRVLVAGGPFNGTSVNPEGSDFGLTRLDSAGALDSSFGTGGTVFVDVAGNLDYAYAITLDGDGNIVLAGDSFNPDGFVPGLGNVGDYDFSVVRLTPTGALDTSFGTGGKVLIDDPQLGVDAHGRDVAVTSDGKIVVAGYSAPFGFDYDFTVVRLNADGSLDSSFDGSGIVIDDAGGIGTADTANALVIDAAGKIVVLGNSLDSGGGYDFSLARVETDGTPDASFGNAGYVTVDIGAASDSMGQRLAIDSAGRIVAIGSSLSPVTGFQDFSIIRLNPDGSLDTSFDGDGKWQRETYCATFSAGINGLVIQPDGKIVVSGNSFFGLTAFRLNPDGSLDPSFHPQDDATIVYTIGSAPVVLASGVAVSDAELVAQGHYAGATLQISRQGGASVEDYFAASGLLGELVEGGALTLDGVTVGTVVHNSEGDLQLLFNNSATASRVNQVLQFITYANVADSLIDPSIALEWRFGDGNVSGAQGFGGNGVGTGSIMIYAKNAANSAFVSGGPGVLNGTLLNDALLGDTEGDTLIGGEGNDRLAGGQGQDTLTGGAGDDVFRFDTLSFEGDDLITDFTGAGQAGGDVIALDKSLFGLSPGALPAAAFQSAAANLAQSPDVRIVYDTRDGALYYDEDGSGTLPAVQFATLAGHPAGLLATDFLVYDGSMGLIEE
jgi:uncharacterized delta-60 repeat protein